MRLKGSDSAKERAKSLRRAPSLPETLLWQQLRSSGLGVRFRRQHPAGPYILDFFCAPAGLAVEVDGEVMALVTDLGTMNAAIDGLRRRA